MDGFAKAVLAVAWIVLAAGFVHSHRPRRGGAAARGPRRTDRGSDLGLALQLVAVAAVFWFRREGQAPGAALAVACVLAPASVVLAWKSVIALGRHWRVRAVVTADHELVMSGPYAWLRHPVYTAFYGMLVATALVLTPGVAGVAAAGVFGVGTEIRVRSEEKLLGQQFGDVHYEYRRRVKGYIPFVW